MKSEFFRWLSITGLPSLVIVVFLSVGCGASRQTSDFQGDEVDLDELLNESEMSPSDDSEEAEVLRLLGIVPVEKEPQADFASMMREDTAQPSSTELDELKDQLDRKDREISILRSELTQKEAQISDLENKAISLPRRRSTSVPAGRAGMPSPEFAARYQNALSQYNNHNYQQALTVFRELLQSDSNNSLSDNCQYWIGECYYGLVNFNQAIVEFEKVFQFANSNKSDDAQLKLGVCYLKLGDKQQARVELEGFLSNYPESEYVSLAQRYLARL